MPSHEDKVGILIPTSLATSIRFPQKALSDGSASPEWVRYAVQQGDSQEMRTDLMVPLTSREARAARSLLKYRRVRKTIIAPIVIVAILSYVATILLKSPPTGFFFLLAVPAIGALIVLLDRGVERDLFTMQTPMQTKEGFIYIPGVHAEVAKEFADLNPGTEVT